MKRLARSVREVVVQAPDEARHGAWGVEPAQGVIIQDAGFSLRRHAGGHRGVEEAGEDCVDANPMRTEVAGKTCGEAE